MRPWIIGLALLTVLAAGAVASAEKHPTSGTFSGYYHRDFLGVGHFSFYLVSPRLHEKLSPYEGKYIKLEVVKAVQDQDPGEAVIQEIGEIQVLETDLAPLMADRLPHVALSVKTRGDVSAGEPFELLVTATGARKEITIYTDTLEELAISLFQPSAQNVENPDAPSILARGYTNRQMARDELSGEYGDTLSPFSTGLPNLVVETYAPKLKAVGESWTWVVAYPGKAARASGEFRATVQGLVYENMGSGIGSSGFSPIEGWGALKVQKTPTTRPAEALLQVEQVKNISTTPGGETSLSFVIKPAKGKTIRVPTLPQYSKPNTTVNLYAVTGRLDAWDEAGNPIELTVKRLDNPEMIMGDLIMEKLPESGFEVKASYIPTDRNAKIKKMTASFVTEEGAETVVLVSN